MLAGEIVQLNSGSPKLRILGFRREVEVEWETEGGASRSFFPEECLTESIDANLIPEHWVNS